MRKNFYAAFLLASCATVFSPSFASAQDIPRAVLNDPAKDPEQMSVPGGTLTVAYNGVRQQLKTPIFTEGPYLYTIASQSESEGTHVYLQGGYVHLTAQSGRFVPMLAGLRVVAVRDVKGTVLLCNPMVLERKIAKCWEVDDGGEKLAVGQVR